MARWLLSGAVVLMLAGVRLADAATFHVSPSGSNGNSCAAAQNPATPKQTPLAGVGCLASGDTLVLHAGTYIDQCLTDVGPPPIIPAGTSWANPTTIRAASGETVWLRSNTQCAGGSIEIDGTSPRYMVFDGINVHGVTGQWTCVGAGTGSHIRFQNMEVKHCRTGFQGSANFSEFLDINVHHSGQNESMAHTCPIPELGCHGLYWNGGDNLFARITSHNHTGIGITLSGDCTPCIVRNVIRDSVWRDNGGYGILAYPNNTIYNNRVYNNYVGINTSSSVYYNTVRNNNNASYNAGPGLGLMVGGGGSGQQVRHNIVMGHAQEDIYFDGTPTSTNNLCTATGGNGCTYSASASALFVNPATHDYHLTSTSPAIGLGAPVSGITTDADGVARPASPALGVFEYVSAGSPVATALEFSVQPGTTPTNTILDPAPTLRVLDQFGAPISSTAMVTIALGANPGGSTLGGSTSGPAVGGLAPFTNLTLNNAGVGYTLVATSPGLTGATSAPFTITSAPPPGQVLVIQTQAGHLLQR